MAFLSVLGNIALFLLILSVLICIHELGHFIFAKRAGILCHEFSFGMGPKIWSRKKGETTFSIRAVPFGGYVAMAGEEIESDVVEVGHKVRLGFDKKGNVNRIVINPNHPDYQDYVEVFVDEIDLQGKDGGDLYINDYTVSRNAYYVYDNKQTQIAPHDRRFNAKTKTDRFLTAVAGPVMNFLLALVVFFVMFLVAGVHDADSTIVSEVAEDSPADGVILPGDEILAINGVDVDAWNGDEASIQSELATFGETDGFVLTLDRDGTTVTTEPIHPEYLFFGLGFMVDSSSDTLTIEAPLYRESPLEAGDVIVKINDRSFTTWDDVIDYAYEYREGSTEDNPLTIVVDRNGTTRSFSYTAYGRDVLEAQGYDVFVSRIGISGSTEFSLVGSVRGMFTTFGESASSIFKTLGLLFSSEQVGVGDLSGFVGIYSLTSNAAREGLVTLLYWVGFLSVNLGILNLLPIPALDGGRIVFIGYEAVTGKKPNQKVENFLHTVVFFLLIALLIFVTYNDILRLF